MTTKFYLDMDMNEIPADETEIISSRQTQKIGRGKEALAITLDVKVRVKKGTQEEVEDNALDNAAMQLFLEAYRKQKGIVGAEEIKTLRDKIGISQRGLATLVGWSSSTIERYEAGSVANPANNRALKGLSNKEVVKEYFLKSTKENYSTNDFQALKKFLEFSENRASFFFANDVADWFIAESLKEQSLDSDASPLTQMKLQKLVYFVQREFLSVFGHLLFEENTLAFEHGCYYKSIGEAHHGKFIFENGELPKEEIRQNYIDSQKSLEETAEVRHVFNDVWAKYGIYEAAYLRKINHAPHTAWYKNYQENKKYVIIPNEDILEEAADL